MEAFKLVQWGAPGQYVDVPKPQPGPGEVLIRMKAAGLCHTDLDMVDSQPGSEPFANSFDAGYILGHENAGYVAELGSSVTDLVVGEAVVHCEAFRRGAICMTRGCGLDGGLAEFLVVPRTEAISIVDGDPVVYAPLTDAAVTAYHAIQNVVQRLKPGTSAALIGIGGLGTYGVQFIKLMTAARVFAVDNAEGRLKVARDVGADETVRFEDDGKRASEQIMSLTKSRGVDAIVDFVGTAETLKLAAAVSRPRGRVVLLGMQGGTLGVSWGLLATSCEFAISLGSTRQDLREVCALVKQGKLRVDVQEFSFDNVQKAYDQLRAGSLVGRAVVVSP
ncbi:Uu.00g076730.m01.CDS01 [Anthostomella pinea]|uniref:Uu.00g076730.m01.CDS01 n=1 Tax=Anthostomella pinea TaxID=933095 RepID=A0AAI8YP83_9PEZI|nr:Uu.00g076730.m01.CDS01 [Anthostomella pinea]